MINPYRPPATETIAPAHAASQAGDAVFQLSDRQIRYAESKYILHRYGGRLTVASLLMIALALLIAIDPAGFFPIGGGETVPLMLSLLVRELIVMVLATIIYMSLIHQFRNHLRQQLAAHGVVDGAGISFTIGETTFTWHSGMGTFECTARRTHLIRLGRGLLIALPDGPFWYVPKNATFSTDGYRRFFQRVKQKARPLR